MIWTENEAGEVAADRWASRAFERAHRTNELEASGPAQEERDYGGPWGPYADGTIPPPWFEGGAMDAGGIQPLGLPPMNEASALRHATVLSCVSLLTDTVMQTALKTYRKGRKGREEIDPPQIVAEPNGEMFDFDFFHQTAESLVGGGNTFLKLVEADKYGYPLQLLPIHPENVDVRRNPKTGRKEAIVLGGYARSSEPLPLDGSERQMVHIPGFTVPGALRGINRLQKAMLTIYSGLAAEAYGARWFKDSANPSSILYSKEPMAPEAVKEAQKEWIRSHQGRRLPAVLAGFDWKPITISPEESQFLQTQKWSTTQVARWWRCPPILVGDVEKTTTWGTGIEEMTLGYLTYGANPYYLRIEKVWSSFLPRGQFCKYDIEQLLRTRTLDRYMSYVHARNAGWMSVNDIRHREEMPPVPGGDSYLQPLNMGPLGTDPTKIKPDPAPSNDPTQEGDDA